MITPPPSTHDAIVEQSTTIPLSSSLPNNISIQPTSPPYMLEQLLETIRDSKSLSDEVLKELAHLFPSTTLVHALELLDKEKIIKYMATPSQRELYAVEPTSNRSYSSSSSSTHSGSRSNSSGLKLNHLTNNNNNNYNSNMNTTTSSSSFKSYKCISHNYCTCQSFAFGVIARKESKYCKHLLAVILADAIGCYKTIQVKDSEMGLLLLDEE
nr:unnamed protein product [Naegleria fowleri]